MYEINLKVTSLYTSLQGLYCKIVYSYHNKINNIKIDQQGTKSNTVYLSH